MLSNCSLASRHTLFFCIFNTFLYFRLKSIKVCNPKKSCDRFLSTSCICQLISVKFNRLLSTIKATVHVGYTLQPSRLRLPFLQPILCLIMSDSRENEVFSLLGSKMKYRIENIWRKCISHSIIEPKPISDESVKELHVTGDPK